MAQLQFLQYIPIYWPFLEKLVKRWLVSRNAVSRYDCVCKKNCPVCAGLCICMQQMINTTSFHLSKMNGGRASSAFHQCVRRIHINTHKHTSMSTCLSVRFYHYRDTVDSPFVRAEKIGALRFQAHTFAMTYKGFACIRMCVSMF